jgi:hypothetical protein
MAPLPNTLTTSPIRKVCAAVATLALLAVGGCSSESSDIWLLYGAARADLLGSRSVTRQEAAAVPYASMGVRLGAGSEVLAVLATDAPHTRLWIAGKRLAVETDGGRIVRTSGFANNLADVSGDLGAPVPPVKGLHQGGERTLLYDFADLNAYSVKVVCRTVEGGSESIKILGRLIPATRMDENCRAGVLDWSFTNTYWVGIKDGMVWRSTQFVHPRLDPITTEILRPPKAG